MLGSYAPMLKLSIAPPLSLPDFPKRWPLQPNYVLLPRQPLHPVKLFRTTRRLVAWGHLRIRSDAGASRPCRAPLGTSRSPYPSVVRYVDSMPKLTSLHVIESALTSNSADSRESKSSRDRNAPTPQSGGQAFQASTTRQQIGSPGFLRNRLPHLKYCRACWPLPIGRR